MDEREVVEGKKEVREEREVGKDGGRKAVTSMVAGGKAG